MFIGAPKERISAYIVSKGVVGAESVERKRNVKEVYSREVEIVMMSYYLSRPTNPYLYEIEYDITYFPLSITLPITSSVFKGLVFT